MPQPWWLPQPHPQGHGSQGSPQGDRARWALAPICTLCGSQENLQRKQVGAMLREWERKHPGRLDNMLHALQNVVPSHLADGTLHDFKGLTATGVASADGDKAFDHEELPAPSMPGLQVIQL